MNEFEAQAPSTQPSSPNTTTTASTTNTAAVNSSHASGHKKHFSIDFSLELEHQLQMELSPPPTPGLLPADSNSNNRTHESSLDPHVLAHIITQLRKSVEDMTRERDDLVKLLEGATTREASLQDTLQLMTEKATDYEEELSAAKKKMKEDEEAIALLRNKVEESRRGLMRLQTESRRQSVVPNSLDLSRAGIPAFGSPPSSKRASFTPLTGRTTTTTTTNNAHRRISSISVDGGANGLGVLHVPDLTPSPNTQTAHFQDTAGPSAFALQGSRRSLFGRYSPPNPDVPLPLPHMSSLELEALKREVESLKKELTDTRAEVAEANEAKEASEMCVKALREFIAENQVGANSTGEAIVKLPPPPTMARGEEFDSDKKAAASSGGWGFKLWKVDTSSKAPMTNTAVSSSTPVMSPVQPTPTASAPFSRKLGGFFSSRASISSTNSQFSSTTPTMQTNAAALNTHDSYRDSVSGNSISDTSSVVEPVSPSYESQGNVKIAGEVVGGLAGKGDDPAGIAISVQPVDDMRPGAIVGQV